MVVRNFPYINMWGRGPKIGFVNPKACLTTLFSYIIKLVINETNI